MHAYAMHGALLESPLTPGGHMAAGGVAAPLHNGPERATQHHDFARRGPPPQSGYPATFSRASLKARSL